MLHCSQGGHTPLRRHTSIKSPYGLDQLHPFVGRQALHLSQYFDNPLLRHNFSLLESANDTEPMVCPRRVVAVMLTSPARARP
jgi:hypothetical protein